MAMSADIIRRTEVRGVTIAFSIPFWAVLVIIILIATTIMWLLDKTGDWIITIVVFMGTVGLIIGLVLGKYVF